MLTILRTSLEMFSRQSNELIGTYLLICLVLVLIARLVLCGGSCLIHSWMTFLKVSSIQSRFEVQVSTSTRKSWTRSLSLTPSTTLMMSPVVASTYAVICTTLAAIERGSILVWLITY
ncbi:hypothetical protein EJ08DRAFT_443237 [Tothia fuscella]|uniref:Uncharacterized protein n=1 Tax=Tothia fuscella TaxID=1048955 RepID=A0A9P4TVB5_9PEZI|nr:hypothetical protein EJ08DRAFT_443237 [Tothia fuscella]